MPGTKVIVSGGGIAGPILAVFLKLKGYEPIVYERGQKGSVGGLSVVLQPNGLRVLSLIPGLYERIPGHKEKKYLHISNIGETPDVLIESDIIAEKVPELFGFPVIGVKRSAFHDFIISLLDEHNVEIKYEHQLVSIEQRDTDVQVGFANGFSDTASFVVGCDGLHSNTRIELFGKEEAIFTGLTQIGGLSPIPDELRDALTNVYGDGKHLINYQITDTLGSWAITIREPEEKETWRAMDDDKQAEFKKNPPVAGWGFGVESLVKNAEKVVKFGLYDRPELKTWYKGRVVLLGDAAHPTSPHLGQGANQAFEDVYHLIKGLVQHNPDASSPSTELLSKIFTEYETTRILRTGPLVKGARQMGELRVVQGVETCKTRDEYVRKGWESDEAIIKSFQNTWAGPFQGKPEI